MDWFNPFEGSEGGGGGSGTDNYNKLINRPSINNVVLSGNHTGDDLGLQGKISSSNKISSDNVNDSGAQNLFTNATEKQTWNAKQDAIQNLQDIQSGAALGATSLQPSDVKSTYSSTGTDPVNGTAIAAAIGTLDVAAVGGSGSFISGISETNGKISATAGTVDSTPTESSTGLVTSAGIYTDQVRQDALEAQDRAALVELVDNGAKNQFDPTSAWDSKTAHGITITRNGDTYSIASGITQSGHSLFINMGYQANANLVPAGDWVLSFDTPQQNVFFQVCWDGALRVNSSFGNNCFFTVPKNTTNSWFRILLRGSTDMSGTSFRIMLCPRVLFEISHAYQPYRPSWQEMWDAIQALQSGGTRSLSMRSEPAAEPEEPEEQEER